MPYYVYILHSAACSRYYCGQTDDLEHRVAQHNDPGHTLTKTTKRFTGPWTLVWHRELATRSEAMALERKIKSRGTARFLEDEAKAHRHSGG